MKKLFCTSFLLFATTLCFAAPAGKTDRVVVKTGNSTIAKAPTTVGEMPMPIPGCSTVPKYCPGF